ncbi:uncharacterized protein LOC120785547 [Xiphias gladius]|uniref:uncharacterized protein LOC120785547 n=1 Tax=Xiphias gladius TaxID=8245 RepID=UPI001A9883D4|nr:uncharacterized protein LOC120785547 [Xiphias gladius]
MKRTRSWIRLISDEEKEDKDRRNSLRKRKRITYIAEDDDEEEDTEEEDEEEDQQDNEQLSPATLKTHNQREQENNSKMKTKKTRVPHQNLLKGLPVTCGDKKGFLDAVKLDGGEECIWCEGSWFAPPAFEDFGGKGSSRKWKATIFHEDQPLQILFEKGILTTKGFKRTRTETTKPKKILSSNLKSESPSEASEIQSAYETEEDDVKDNRLPGSDNLALETEEAEEERVGTENGEEGVDSGDDKSKEEEDKLEKGEMEDENLPAVIDNKDDNRVFEENETNLIISTSVKNALQTVKIVIERLQQAKSDHQSKCTENAEEDSWAATHSGPSQMSNVPSIVPDVKEENGEGITQCDERKHGQTEIKTDTGNPPRPLSVPATSDIKPNIVNKTEDTGSITDHTANLNTSSVPLGDIKADWEEKEDGALETGHSRNKEKKWKRKEHLDMSSSEASIQPFATGNIRDVTSNTVTTQQNIKDESIEAMSPSNKLQSVLVQCKHDNLGHTDTSTYSHDAAQLQIKEMKQETRHPQTTQASDSTYSSDMEEGLSSRPSTSINHVTMDLDQLKREKIKLQLKVLKLQEEYYALKIKELKK